MASDGVVPDHSSDEQVEKKANEELKTMEQGGITLPKENKVIEGEEQAKAEGLVSVKAPTESEEVGNMQIVPPAIADAGKVEKFDETPDSDVPVTDGSQVGASPDSKLDISSVPDSVVEVVEKEPEESSKIPDVTESSIEALDKPVELLESPTKDSEPDEVGKKPGVVSVVEPIMVEKQESVAEVEGKPQEQSEGVDEKYQTLDPDESVDKDITTDAGTKADESLKEVVSIVEPKLLEKPESVFGVGGKPLEAEEVEESEMLKPKESIDNDSRNDGASDADESLKEEASVVEPKTVEKSESVVEMGGNPQEQAEEVEKKSEILEPKESMDNDITKDEVALIDMVKEDTESLKEKEVTTDKGPVTSESATIVSASQGAESAQKEDGINSVTPDVVENVCVDDTKKEVGFGMEKAAVHVGDIKAKKEEKVQGAESESGLEEDGTSSVTPDVVEIVSVDDTKKEVGVDEEKAAVQVGDIEAKYEEKVLNIEESKDKDVKIEELTKPERTETIEEKEAKNMKIDQHEENNVKKEELMLPEGTETKDVSSLYTATEVTEKNSEEQSAPRDAEMSTEENKEHEAKVDAPDSKGEVDVVDSNVVNEPTAESKQPVMEGQAEESIQSCVDNLDKRVVVEETAKSGTPNVELSKIENNPKTDQEPPKQEVLAKPSQKHSNNIISKVKQSIVKVKKAIIGKSPSSKTLSSESKGDLQNK